MRDTEKLLKAYEAAIEASADLLLALETDDSDLISKAAEVLRTKIKECE